MLGQDSSTRKASADAEKHLTPEDQEFLDDETTANQLAEAFAKALNEGILKNHQTS